MDRSLRRALLPLGLAIGLAATIFGLLVWLEGREAGAPAAPAPTQSEPPQLLDRVAGRVLRPGALAAAHGNLEGAAACTRCHGLGSSVPDARCLSCHEEIGVRAERALPLHGTLVGDCAGCHVDHQGSEAQLIVLDREAFQHAQSRYPLDGAHAALDCESCHTLLDADGETTFRYQGVPYASCDACHLDLHDSYTPAAAGVVPIREVALDAPGPSFVPAVADVSRLSERRACADCHRTSSFLADGLLDDSFQHDSHTEFALEGAHAEVRCGACHTDAIRERERALGTASGQGAERACGECHDDPHRASLGDAASCASCHVAESWTQKFDHTEHTEFALDPLHAQISCESCHEDLRFQSRGSDCAACHGEATQLLEGRWGEVRGEPDPHLGAAECGDCHGESPAENSTTALADRCVDCHTPTYGPLMVSWRSQIDSLAARAERSSEVEWLRKSGLHNFVLSRRLLVERAAAASGAPR